MKENKFFKILSVFADLIKYKLSLAVTLSSVAGYFLAGGKSGINLLFISAGVFLLSSGAAALNQYTEREADLLMERTRHRPLPSGRISIKSTLVFSFILLAAGAFFLIITGLIPILLGLITVLLYNVVYTRLKKKTAFSIIPGALVGAIPPMIGYSSAGGSLLNREIMVFATFMFLWQLPHFWLILISHGRDYSKAGFATISKYINDHQIRNLVFFWVLLTTLFILLFFLLTDSLSKNIFIVTAILNFIFIILFYRLLFRKEDRNEIRGAFILINSISLLIMLFIIIESFFM